MSTLRVDAVTVEVVRALAGSGVRAIVLKGPAIAGWLYDEPGARLYADCDLLVAPGTAAEAGRVLRRLDFRPDEFGLMGAARSWRRGPDCVDLHTALVGIAAPPNEAWDVLTRDTDEIIVAGAVDVEVLGPAARTLHLALHVAQHDDATTKPRIDLERGLSVLPRSTWAAAGLLATRLDAEAAYTTGLRRATGGPQLLAELDVRERSTPITVLVERGAPPAALGIAQLAATRSAWDLPAAVGRAVFPSPGYMRRTWPGADRGRLGLGLGLAYIRRLAHLVRHLPAGIAAWREAKRSGRE